MESINDGVTVGGLEGSEIDGWLSRRSRMALCSSTGTRES
jgi:hypothetical protein